MNDIQAEKKRVYDRARYQKNKKARNAQIAEWRERNPVKWRRYVADYNMRRSHGTGLEEAENLLVDQKGLCGICGTKIKIELGAKHMKRAVVDHCHVTGKVRGMLCGRCNIGIGALGDSAEVVQKAFEWLNKETYGHENS